MCFTVFDSFLDGQTYSGIFFSFFSLSSPFETFENHPPFYLSLPFCTTTTTTNPFNCFFLPLSLSVLMSLLQFYLRTWIRTQTCIYDTNAWTYFMKYNDHHKLRDTFSTFVSCYLLIVIEFAPFNSSKHFENLGKS